MEIAETMQALVWVAPRQMELQITPRPRVAPDEVLIRVERVGICGSELSGYLGHNALRVPPLVMGHEFSGVVVEVGASVKTVNLALSEGQRVTANPMVFCGECEYCRVGDTGLCVNRRLVGAHRPGAHAEFVAVPARVVLPLHHSLTTQEGALVEPAACAVRIARWIGNCEGKTILVTGAGTIGLLTLQILISNGASRVWISDTDPERREAAKAVGGECLNPFETDIVEVARGSFAAVDAVGKAVTREQCIRSVRPGGKVILSGLHEESSVIPVADVIRREIRLYGCFCYSMEDFSQAMQLLREKKVRLVPWIIEAPLSEGGRWFEQLCSDRPGRIAKVLLIP
jgi:2-desacetyl-2-hydroxyethyl bacteriochlorophyllide A dehydrogenase